MASRAESNNDASISNAKVAVERIVSHIETNFKGFNISEIIKAGSLGDGTAVIGNYDIDLVIYSRAFTGIDVKNSCRRFGPWLSQLREFMEKFEGVSFYKCERAVNFSVQFSYQVCEGLSLDVDILISPYWENPKDFYQFLKDEIPRRHRMMYSVCASKWQREFFKKQHNQVVKEYIRRAKAWRNREWGKSKYGKPKSYLLSLLIVRAYKNSHGGDAHSVTRALKMLVKAERMDVYWADGPNDFYKRSDYKDLLPSRPRVIDPANPANNVWESGFIPPGQCALFLSRIDTIDLSMPI